MQTLPAAASPAALTDVGPTAATSSPGCRCLEPALPPAGTIPAEHARSESAEVALRTTREHLRASGLPSHLQKFYDTLSAEFHAVVDELRTMPYSITVFGSGRAQPGDVGWQQASDVGRELVEHGIVPKTGAGSGTMEAALKAFVERLQGLTPDEVATLLDSLEGPASAQTADPRAELVARLQTQGFPITLPYETRVTPFVQHALKVTKLPSRKLGLFTKSAGFINVIGGFGTYDEVFEVLALKQAGWHHQPIALLEHCEPDGYRFWGDVFAALSEHFGRHMGGVLDPSSLLISTSPERVVDFVSDGLKTMDDYDDGYFHTVGVDDLADDLSEQLHVGLDGVAAVPPAVLVGGADTLDPNQDHDCLDSLGMAARMLHRRGTKLRTDADGELLRVLSNNVSGEPGGKVQRFVATPENSTDKQRVVAVVNDYMVRREVMCQNLTGAVFLPADPKTLDKLFTLLCEIKAGKRPQIPVVLVGNDNEWREIFDCIGAAMLPNRDGMTNTISKEFLDLVTMTNDPVAIARAVRGPSPDSAAA